MVETKSIEVEVIGESSQVQIADDVIAIIAEIASMEVEGIVGIGGKNDLVQTIRGKKAAKGIRVEVGEGEVYLEVMCIIAYGVKIQEACLKLQEKVKNSIETMTGLTVKAVDVQVVGVEFPKTKTADEY